MAKRQTPEAGKITAKPAPTGIMLVIENSQNAVIAELETVLKDEVSRIVQGLNFKEIAEKVVRRCPELTAAGLRNKAIDAMCQVLRQELWKDAVPKDDDDEYEEEEEYEEDDDELD